MYMVQFRKKKDEKQKNKIITKYENGDDSNGPLCRDPYNLKKIKEWQYEKNNIDKVCFSTCIMPDDFTNIRFCRTLRRVRWGTSAASFSAERFSLQHAFDTKPNE